MSWMKDYLPDKEYIDKMSQHLQQFRSRISWQDIPNFKVCYFLLYYVNLLLVVTIFVIYYYNTVCFLCASW